MANTGTQKIKKIVARALEIREKAGYTTEIINKKRYNMPYIPDAVKRAAKELKTSGTAPAKRTKRTVKTKFIHFKKSNMGLHKNYVELKKKHPKHIILIRIGEFYETYERDAINVSKVLGTTLIYRGKIATTGFPIHSLNYKLPTLVNAGYNIAIADRLEDSKLPKTPVKRGIPKENEKRTTRIVKTKQLAQKKVTVKTSISAQAPPLKLVQQKERSPKKRFIWIKKNGKTFKQSYGISAVDLLKKSELDKFHFVFKNIGLHGLYEALTKREIENEVEFYGKLIQEIAENGKYLTGVARKRCNFDGWSFDKVEKMPAKIKPGMYGLVNIVIKDDLRPVLSGVYVDNGVLVATDAQKLIVIKDAENEAKKYNGKIIGILKNNMKQVIDGRYPAYNKVIPKMENQKEVSAFFPIDDILPAVNGAALIYKNQESGYKVQILILNGIKVGVNAEFFANLLNALKCNGSKKIKIGVTDQTSGVIIHTDNGNIGLCMPVLVDNIDNPENKFTVKPIKI